MMLSVEQAQRVIQGRQTLVLYVIHAEEFASWVEHGQIMAVWRYKPDYRGQRGPEHHARGAVVRGHWQILEDIATARWIVDWGQDGHLIPRRDYAVCPGGGRKALGRVKVTRIRKTRLHDLTAAEIAAFAPEAQLFGLQYCPGLRKLTDERWTPWAEAGLVGGARGQLAVEWDAARRQRGTWYYDNPELWALTVAVVGGGGDAG